MMALFSKTITASFLSLMTVTCTCNAMEFSKTPSLLGIAENPGINAAGILDHSQRTYSTGVLLFSGDGTWKDEVAALEKLMEKHKTTYYTVNSEQLNSMTVDDLSQFGLFIFPGGEGGTQANSLNSRTRARIRLAVQKHGVSYLGFCAGAFIAVAPAPEQGQDPSYGLGIVDGPVLNYYYLENTINPDISMTLETFADGTKRDLLWYGGPVTPDVAGTVVAKYPSGDPAISEGWSGSGFVILSAVHPAAPQSIRNVYGLQDSDGLDMDVAWILLSAALHQQPLPAFN